MTDRTVRIFATMGLGKAIGVAGALGATLLIGRVVGVDGLGRWTLLVAGATMLHTVFISWTQPSVIRFGCEEWNREGSLSKTLSARAPLLLPGLIAVAFLLTANPAHILTRSFGAGPGDILLIAVYLLGLWSAAEAQSLLQATNRLIVQAYLSSASAVLGLTLLFALAGVGRLTVEAAVIAGAMALVLIWLPAWMWVLARARHSWTRPNRSDISRHVTYAVPLLLTFGVGYLSDWGDHLLLRIFASVGLVGLFSVAYQVFSTLTAANGLLSTVILPTLIANHTESQANVLSYLDRVVPTILTIWMLATIWVVAFLPIVLMRFAGDAYRQGMTCVLLLCAVVPSSAVTSLYTVLFNLQQRMPRLSVYVVIMTLVNLSLSAVLIPNFGIVGAAIGTAVSYLLVQVCYVWDQHRRLSVNGARVWGIWGVAVTAGICQVGLGHGAGPRTIWALAASGAVVWTVRRLGGVDPPTLNRIMAGPLAPFAPAATRALVPQAARL